MGYTPDNRSERELNTEVPQHLAHLPALCGRCGHDHRLAMAVDSTEQTEREYGEMLCSAMKLEVLEDDPIQKIKDQEYAQYWKNLYEAELRHRYAHPELTFPGRSANLPPELQVLLDKLGPAIAGIFAVDPKNGSLKKLG